MSRIRILIADNAPSFREGLSRLLSREPDIEVIASAGDALEAVRLTKALSPDLAIIDVAMPAFSGIAAARRISADCPGANILLFSVCDSERCLATFLRSGATKYLLRSCSLAELIGAIRSRCQGYQIPDMESTSNMLGRIVCDRSRERHMMECLQPRELEVLKLAAKGMKNREISRELCLSGRTVEAHLLRVYRKLGVSSRTQAVLRALKHGWLSLYDLPLAEKPHDLELENGRF